MVGEARLELTAEVRFGVAAGWVTGLVGRADDRSVEVELRLPLVLPGVRPALRLVVAAPELSDAHRLARALSELLSPAGAWTAPDWRRVLLDVGLDADWVPALRGLVDQAIRDLPVLLAPREEDRG